MTNRKINSILGVIKRPNNTFREIYQNGEDYFKISIIILVLSSFFTVTFTFDSTSKFPTNELGYILDAEIQIIDHSINILSGFLFVVLVFFVGKKLGGSKNFRSIFSVLSYSSIPILLGGIIVSIFLYYPPLLESISGIDLEDPTFPMLFWVLYLGIFFPFSIWSLILSIKAIKIANNFGTGKAIGITIIVIMIMTMVFILIYDLNFIDHPYFTVNDSIFFDQIDPQDSIKVVETDRIEIGPWPNDIEVNPNENLIYVAHHGALTQSGKCKDFIGITVFDASSYQVVDYIEIPTEMSNIILGFDENENQLHARYKIENGAGLTAIIDGTTHEIIPTDYGVYFNQTETDYSEKPTFHGIDFSVHPETGMLYRTDLLDRALYVWDSNPYQLKHVIKISDGPNGVTINPTTNLIYTANSGNIDKLGQSISVIDGNSHTVKETIELEKRPSDVYINPITNNLYVFSYYTNSISVLDGTTYDKITEFETIGKPWRIAVNSNTQTLYILYTGGTNILSVIDMSTNTIIELKNKYDNLDYKCPTLEEKLEEELGLRLGFYLNLDIIFALIFGALMYVKGRTEQKVNVKLQMLFSALPVIWIWSLYKIKKIRKGLLLILGFKIFFGGAMSAFLPLPYDFAIFFAITTPIFVYVFRKWSIKWNEKLSESIMRSSGSQPIH